MIVTAIFKAKPGKELKLLAELHSGAVESWKEEGVLGYYVHKVTDQSGTYMNIEVYKDAAAFASHLQTTHVKSFLGKLEDLLAEPLTVYQGNPLFGGENSKATL